MASLTESTKPIICEPLKDGVLLTKRLEDVRPSKVLLIFWHGVGDLVMFLEPFRAVRRLYPWAHFVIGIPKGLTHEEMLPDDIPYHLLTAEEVNDTTEILPYDLIAKITFPMSEGQIELTKGEFCCVHELGIPPVCGHGRLDAGVNRLVAVHFQITCLPESCNPDRDTAERVWNDILEAGYIPIECHFQHIFHNPVNQKFDFVDSTVRRCRPRVSSLVGLLRACHAFVGVVSGPFHVALSVLPPERVFLLEKDFKKECFTKLKIGSADLRNYQNEVNRWIAGVEYVNKN
jgi:hypothetical protein